jgi:hypothetical protein
MNRSLAVDEFPAWAIWRISALRNSRKSDPTSGQTTDGTHDGELDDIQELENPA